jgi:hypothetical protein
VRLLNVLAKYFNLRLTREPLKTATLKFVAKGTQAKLKTSNRNGKIIKKTAYISSLMVKALTEGSYLVIINKLGYKEQTVTVNVSDGETTHLKMELEKA